MVSVNPVVPNMRMFQSHLTASSGVKYSMSCSCVDSDGIETAKTILSSYIQQNIHCLGFGEEFDLAMIGPSVNIVNLRMDGKVVAELQEIPLSIPPPLKVQVLSPGVKMLIECLPPVYLLNSPPIDPNCLTEPYLVRWTNLIHEDSLDMQPYDEWGFDALSKNVMNFLPLNRHKYFYQYVVEDGKHKLVPMEYSKVLGTNAAGFKVEVNVMSGGIYNYDFPCITNPMSSIIVSKTNEEVINLTYACGKLTKAQSHMNGEEKEREDVRIYRYSNVTIRKVEHNTNDVMPDTPRSSGSHTQVTHNDTSSGNEGIVETRSLSIWGLINIAIHPTDPYLHGCGINDPSEELFRDDTVPLLNNANEKIGCEVDIAEGDASFYCPLPYHTEPPNCIPKARGCLSYPLIGAVSVKKPGGQRNKNFYIFTRKKGIISVLSGLQCKREKVFECHCVTNTGLRMVTIRVHT
ncbi:hypothetical protein BgAZ_304140 [Babesia gibsoni]|uniref:6-Cys domain-containing protein n=1 Tax=Babesia gibsoni TaxID=33632 RepID=A0AAD8LPL9_BABGI|nr:hypothetical protein BgAZ_304140 [Babesia gibsoni]